MKAVVFMLVLSTMVLSNASARRCQIRDEDRAINFEGRTCRKACTTDRDCKGALKRCICDGSCGNSCFNANSECEEPETITNGKYLKTSLRHGGYVYYTCNNGLILRGISKRRCNSDKKWSFSDDLPRCERGCQYPLAHGRAFPNPRNNEFPVDSTVKYECNYGYLPNEDYNPIIRCLDDFTWSTLSMQCHPKSCPTLNDPDHGRLASDANTFASSVNVECNIGYTASSSVDIICVDSPGEHEAVWSGQLPTCEVNECPSPTLPEHVKIQKPRDIYKYQDRILFSCEAGYELKGRASAMCRADKTWGELPTCQVDLKCDFEDFHNPFCGYTASRSWRRQYYVNAKSGNYVAKTQTSSQTLTSMVADKVPGMCVKFWYRTNGFAQLKETFENILLYKNHDKEARNVWESASIPITYDDIKLKLEFESVGGSLELDQIMVGTDECVDNCTDDPCLNGGTCVNRINKYTCFCTIDFEGANCENDLKCSETIPFIDNGSRTEINLINNFLLEDSTVTYQCNVNYKFSGRFANSNRVVRTCRSTREWYPPIQSLRCEEILCREVNLLHGIIHHSGRRRRIEAQITFECDATYHLTSSYSSVVCQRDGRWSRDIPTCQKIQCQRKRLPDGFLLSHVGASDVGYEVQLTCKSEYKKIGNGAIVCQDNGEWSTINMQCIELETSVSNVCAANLPRDVRESRDVFISGSTLTFECKHILKEIRGNANVTCLLHGKLSGMYPECVYKQPSHTYVAGGTEYVAYVHHKLNKTIADGFCKEMGEGSLLIAYLDEPRKKVNITLESINEPNNEYWLAMTHVKPRKIKKKNRSGMYYVIHRNDWKWPDGRVTFKADDTAWQHAYDKPKRGYCPVIGRKLCGDPRGKYCWILRSCSNLKPLVCQRALNPCTYSPCRNMGTCRVDSENRLGYRCTCRPLYSGENCADENFCALKENLSPSIAIDNLHAVQVERGVLVWRTGDTVTFRCVDQNERIQNNAVLQCIGNGVWNASFPSTCEKYKCASPHEILNGHFSSSNVEHTIGAVITFSCNDGYLLEGDSTSKCLETGDWSHASTTCHQKPGCKIDLNLPAGLDVKLPSYEDKYTYFYRHDHEYTFYCMNNEEYSTVLTCANEIWSKDLLLFECDSGRGFTETCTRPPPPHNGYFYGRYQNQTTFEIGDEMLFSCNVGYELNGWNGITCREVGVWDPDDYNICINAGCEVTFDLSPDVEVVEVPVGDELDYKYQHNHEYTFQCMPNHAYTTLLTCNNGRWSEDFSLLDCDNGAGFIGASTSEGASTSQTVSTPQSVSTSEGASTSEETCSQPSPPKNGYFPRQKDIFFNGVGLGFSCNDGYEFSGKKKITCREGNIWEPSNYNCVGVVEDPPEVGNEE